MLATGGVRSIVQVADAGDEALPAGSVAMIVKVWLPAARPVLLVGLGAAAAAPESSVQLNVDPALFELNERLADVSLVGFAGGAAVLATGGVRSIDQV